MTFTKQTLIALAVIAGCASAVPACSNADAPAGGGAAEGTTGRIHLNLAVGADTLSSVDMKIFTGTTATGTAIITRAINVASADATVSAFVGALAGGDYTVTFDATTDGAHTTCHGQDVFTIVTGTTGNKTVTITCGTVTAAPARGNEILNGTVVSVSDCPYLKNTVITPLQSGGPIAASTETSDAASTVEWKDGTTAIGATGTGTASGTLDCATVAAGPHTLTVTVTKAGTACTESISQVVTCVGGTGGGTGGAGTGGAGTGGAGTGGAAETGGVGTGGVGTGGAPETGGVGTGGAPETGGAGTGGAPETGGAGTGGAGTGGAGTGGAPETGGVAAVTFCEPPHPATPKVDVPTCQDCEANNCDVPVTPGCTKYAVGSADRAACEDVLTCFRSSNCINLGTVNCYCGTAGISQCKADATVANGACKGRITTTFPAGTDPTTILNSLVQLTNPAGTAAKLGQCDNDFCGDTSANECVPYCN